MSIKKKLIVCFGCMAVLPILLLGALVDRETLSNYEAAFESDAIERMRLVDTTFSTVLDSVKRDVDYLAESTLYGMAGDTLVKHFEPDAQPDVRSGIGRQIKADLARFVRNRPSVIGAYYGSSFGGFIGEIIGPQPGEGYDPRQRPWYTAALQAEPSAVVTSPYASPKQEPMISVAKAIAGSSGSIIGVVSVDLTLEELTDLVESARFGDTGYMMLVDRNGTILANPAQRELIFRRVAELQGELFERLSLTGPARFSADADGLSKEVVTYQSRETGWEYVSVIDSAEIYAPVLALNRTIFLVAFATAIVFATIGILLALRITAPINRVARDLELIAADSHDGLHSIEVRSTDEIGALVSQFNKLLKFTRDRQQERLRAQKLEAVGQLSAGIAHEINTPCQYVSDNLAFVEEALSSLYPLLSFLATDEPEASTAKAEDLEALSARLDGIDVPFLRQELPVAVAQAREGLMQVAQIVRAMKDFSHPGDEVGLLEVESMLGSIVTVARNEWKLVADVDIKVDEGVKSVECIPSLISQSVLNLIVNAAHAIGERNEGTGERGKIDICASVVEQSVEISVADTGVGIQPDQIDRIFDPFFTTKEVGKGTGQGLALVHNAVVGKHHGGVRVRNNEVEGATFTIAIPVSFQGSLQTA